MVSSSLSVSSVGIFRSRYLYNADNCFLMLTCEMGVAFNIRTEDGSEFPFKALGGYGIILLKKLERGYCICMC